MRCRLTRMVLVISCIGAVSGGAATAHAATKVVALPFVSSGSGNVELAYRLWLGVVDQLGGLPGVEVCRQGVVGRALWSAEGSSLATVQDALPAVLREAEARWVLTGYLRTDEQGRLRCTGLALRAGDAQPHSSPDYIIADGAEQPRAASDMAAYLATLVTGRETPRPAPRTEDVVSQVTMAGRALEAAVRAARADDPTARSDRLRELTLGVAALMAKDDRTPPTAALEEMLRSALVLEPGHIGAILLLGGLHLSRGARSDALAAFQWAATLAPDLTPLSDLSPAQPRTTDLDAWRRRAIELATIWCGVGDAATPTGPGEGPAEVAVPSAPIEVTAPAVEAEATEPRQPAAVTEPSAPADDRCVVLYTFAGGSGASAVRAATREATAGALDLELPADGSAAWTEGGGLTLGAPGSAVATRGPATPLIQALQTSGELTLELLVTPARPDQHGPARILSLSVDTARRNFTLAQEGDQYVLRLRTTGTDEQGMPEVRTPAGTLQAARQHVVATYGNNLIRLYVDGKCVVAEDRLGGFDNWSPDYRLLVGNEGTLDRPWQGVVERAAIYDRALRADEVEALCRELESGGR